MASPVPGNADAAPAPRAAGNSLSLATQNKVGSVPELSPPQRLGGESQQGSIGVPTGNQCPAALTRARGKRCCWDPLGAPTPALHGLPHPVASILGRGVLLPQWDEDGRTGDGGLTFPQRTQLWRMKWVGMGSPSFLGEVTACTSPRNLVALCHLGVIAGAQICDHSCAQVEELLCRFGAQECAEGEEAKIPTIGQAQPCPVPLCHQSGRTEPPRDRSVHLEGLTPHSSPIPPAFPQPRLIPKTLIGTGGTFGLPPAELLPSNLAGRHRLELCITPLTPLHSPGD